MTPESNSSQPNPPQSIATVENLNGASHNVPGEPAITVAAGEHENLI